MQLNVTSSGDQITNINTQNASCFCTWQQLNFILNFLESKFRKELAPERYSEYVEDQIAFLDGEIMNYCSKHRDISTLMGEQQALKTDYDKIITIYHDITMMLHFAVFEKDLKENHDCRQFGRLKYAYIQKIAAKLELYADALKEFLDQRINSLKFGRSLRLPSCAQIIDIIRCCSGISEAT